MLKPHFPSILLFFVVISLSFKNVLATVTGDWLQGDLHSHSIYSDGDSSISTILEVVEELKLDFFAITDHDHHQHGVLRHWQDPAYYSPTAVLLYGVEWTSVLGHGNIFAPTPFDYAAIWETTQRKNPQQAIELAHANKALFSINHPYGIRTFSWLYGFKNFDFDTMEIWNATFKMPIFNQSAVQQWDQLNLQGRFIAGIGGSDTHKLQGPLTEISGIGRPTTWVKTNDRTPAGILTALKSGHCYLTSYPNLIQISFQANINGENYADNVLEIGEKKSLARGSYKIELALKTKLLKSPIPGQEYKITLVKNGEVYHQWPVNSLDQELVFYDDLLIDQKLPNQFYRLEISGKVEEQTMINEIFSGDMIAISNPIYFYLGNE